MPTKKAIFRFACNDHKGKPTKRDRKLPVLPDKRAKGIMVVGDIQFACLRESLETLECQRRDTDKLCIN